MSAEHRNPSASGIEIREVPRSDLVAAIELVARAMAPNPLHIAVFGKHETRRIRALRSLFSVLLADGRQVLGAYRVDELVGVIACADSPRCLLTWRTWHRYLPVVFRSGWRAPLLGRWLASWARRDPSAAHSHLGPLAVDARLQRQGIGAALMRHYLAHFVSTGQITYLETDSATNVRFYERFGFRTATRTRLLGVTNWFMVQNPSASLQS
ncbi:MAG TPA: GNAT family N-acetyltransferase [Actinomycetales bacterium]|nr:GNAT family N-acetyltransferase [Actinomycetales bacterium]